MRTHRALITILALTLLAGTTSSAIAQSAEPSADPAMTPAWVTGTLTLAPGCIEPTSTTEAGVEHQRGFRCEPQTWTTTDPRLTGTASSALNVDVYLADRASISVSSGTYDVRNDGGGWLCHRAGLYRPGLTPDDDNDEMVTCVGNGGYEGLTAVLVNDWTTSPITITGIIFAGEVPPNP